MATILEATLPPTCAEAVTPGSAAQSVPVLTTHRSVRRRLIHRWELIGVMALLGSSGVCALYGLCHLAG